MEFKQITELGLTEQKAKQVYDEILKYIDNKVQENLEVLKQEHLKEIENLQKDTAIEKELALNGARNIKAVMALIDKDKLTIKNGQVSLLKNKIRELKESPETSFLFFSPENQNFKGITPFESKMQQRRKIENMDYEELCNYYNGYYNI